MHYYILTHNFSNLEGNSSYHQALEVNLFEDREVVYISMAHTIVRKILG